MILFFGPTGSGKSMQAQILVARHGWSWLSMGQLLRDSQDPELMRIMKTGELVPDEITNEILFAAIDKIQEEDSEKQIIVDGYPRELSQARDLVAHNTEKLGKIGINMVLALEVDRENIIKRLTIRKRAEDDEQSISRRLDIYQENTEQIFDHENFVRNLCTTKNCYEWSFWGTDRIGEVFDFFRDEEADDFRLVAHCFGDGDHGSVCPVAGTKGIVAVNVGQGGKFGRKGRIAVLFAGLEADVFEYKNAPGTKRGGFCLGVGTNRIRGKNDRLA